MKIRNGFVSNSSSSSFCIFGTEVDSSMIPENCDDKYAFFENLLEGTDLQYHRILDYDGYIGRSWDSIKDDETGAAFKKDVEDKLQKLFGKPIECSTIEESWYNG
jgi:hypothetical protein